MDLEVASPVHLRDVKICGSPRTYTQHAFAWTEAHQPSDIITSELDKAPKNEADLASLDQLKAGKLDLIGWEARGIVWMWMNIE